MMRKASSASTRGTEKKYANPYKDPRTPLFQDMQFLKKALCVMLFVAFTFLVYLFSRFLLPASFSIDNHHPDKIINMQTNQGCSVPLEKQHQRIITLTSFNIAGAVPSKTSPSVWTSEDSRVAIRDEILHTNPDVIALQESPSRTWAQKTFDDGYQSVGSTPSHAGYVDLLVRRCTNQTIEQVELPHLPAVAARLRSADGGFEAVVASVHLEPFENENWVRREQLNDLKRLAGTNVVVIVAGDTNMRDSEDESIEALGYLDAWKVAGSNEATRYSWDTTDHSGVQNLYYGARTRAYQKRYDRMYVAVPGESTSRTSSSWLQVTAFDLIANKPISPSKDHFLSDHFGVCAELHFEQQ